MDSLLTEICADGELSFTEILKLIFQGIREVISSIDIDIYSKGSVGISLWELILGFVTVSIIFGFFLKSRSGSVLGSVENYNEYQNSKRAERERRERETYNESYEAYQNRRSRNEWYGRKYNAERGRSNE